MRSKNSILFYYFERKDALGIMTHGLNIYIFKFTFTGEQTYYTAWYFVLLLLKFISGKGKKKDVYNDYLKNFKL